jgi:hypothetical protein
VDPNNYEAGFETVARAALHFAPPESTGRNIWANLTGGTNVMNAALFQVAVLSGLISRLYYTFVAERRYVNYLQPPTTDSARFCWDEVPLFKTAVDEVYRAVLEELQEMNGAWCDGKELLTRLKSRAWGHLGQVQAQGIAAMEFQTFCQEFLNKLDGRELERRKLPDNTKMPEVRLSPRGKRLLEQLESPLYQALIQRGQGKKVEAADLTADLELEELWSKP